MIECTSTSHPKGFSLPNWVVWLQCIAFVVLYAVWILPEIVGFRNTALVIGALLGLYSLFCYRWVLFRKQALALWLILALFAWIIFHLFFLSQNRALEYVEFLRIWKYAGLGAIMAAGLGLSLIQTDSVKSKYYWYLIFFGLCTPVLIYLVKYMLSTYGVVAGFKVPASLRVYEVSQPFYVPKTDYVAFCLPAFSVALGQLLCLSNFHDRWQFKQFFILVVQVFVIAGTLFLFTAQNIKNGIVYAGLLVIIFAVSLLFTQASKLTLKRVLVILIIFGVLFTAGVLNVRKNDSWRTLIADTKIGLQLEKYPNWKDTDKYGYPVNEYGTTVSGTNYERASWAYAGFKLSLENPFGYGLIEDSFAKMAKVRWPDVGNTLSHSHSGWLDVILAIGYPGFLMIFGALLITLRNARSTAPPWSVLIFWPLLANLLLWCTTEVSATVTFAALIFWVCLGAGLSATQAKSLLPSIQKVTTP